MSKKLPLYIYTVLTGFAVIACSDTIDEDEGRNETLSAPQHIRPGTKIKGSLGPKDQDVYLVKTESAECLSVKATGMKGIDHRLDLFWKSTKKKKHRKDGRLFSVDGAPRQADEEVYPLYVRPGAFFVQVSRSPSDPGRKVDGSFYILTVEPASGCGGEDSEHEGNNRPDKSADQAGHLKEDESELTGRKTGIFHFAARDKNPGDTDVYSFKVRKEKYILSVTAIQAAEFDPAFEVFRNGKSILYQNRKTSGAERLNNLLLEPGAPYYLAVTESTGKAGPAPYTLDYRIRKWTAEEEFEPNDKKESAVPLEAGTKTAALLDGADDTDTFLLKRDKEGIGKYILFISSPSEWPGKVSVIMPSKKIVEYIKPKDEDEWAFPGITLKTGQQVFIQINLSADKTQTELITDGIHYQIYAKPLNWKSPVEAEPNDQKVLATITDDENTIIGFIHHKNDVDIYDIREWDPSPGDILTISGIEGITLKVDQLNSAGKQLATKTADSPGKKLTVKAKAQTAYVRVQATGYVSKKPVRKYRLALED